MASFLILGKKNATNYFFNRYSITSALTQCASYDFSRRIVQQET